MAAKLSELLLEQGKVTNEDLARARALQRKSGEKLQAILVGLGIVSEHEMAEALATYYKLALVEANKYPALPVLEQEEIPFEYLRKAKAIPIYAEEDQVVLAMADPSDFAAINAVQIASGKKVVPRIGIPSDIETAFDALYNSQRLTVIAEPEATTAPPASSKPPSPERAMALAMSRERAKRGYSKRRSQPIMTKSFAATLIAATLGVAASIMLIVTVLAPTAPPARSPANAVPLEIIAPPPAPAAVAPTPPEVAAKAAPPEHQKSPCGLGGYDVALGNVDFSGAGLRLNTDLVVRDWYAHSNKTGASECP